MNEAYEVGNRCVAQTEVVSGKQILIKPYCSTAGAVAASFLCSQCKKKQFQREESKCPTWLLVRALV